MMDEADIRKVSSAKFREIKKEYLDEKWKKDFPEGKYYIVICKKTDGTLYEPLCGRLTARPTAIKHTKEEGSDPYVSASFHNVSSHKTFDTKEKFLAAVEKLGITNNYFVNKIKLTPIEVTNG